MQQKNVTPLYTGKEARQWDIREVKSIITTWGSQ